MNKFKEILKFQVLPKKLYLQYSAENKFRRSVKSQESELKLLPQLVNKDMTAIDVGANTGLYTYFLSKYAGRVIAFEPHTLFADFLSKAVDKNVMVINKGVSNNNAKLPFYVPVKSGRKQMNIASFDEATNKKKSCIKQMIETITLDSMKLTDVGYIKVDVEGHEYEVLQGAAELIKSQKPVIQIEILGKPEDKANNRSLKLLADIGYGTYVYLENELKDMNAVDSSRFGKNFICIPV